MTLLSFAATFDYRCPFARNAHEHIVRGLQAGADWDVEFLPFSLSQAKVEAGQPDTWDDPANDSGLLALQVGVAVRDTQPEQFGEAHLALFALRHDQGRSIRDEGLLRDALTAVGVDADAAFEEVATGEPLRKVREAHERGADQHAVWGVPTLIAGGQSVFVRLMDRPDDPKASLDIVERLIDMATGWPELNEFKHTSIPR
jgi:hypothetical protein